MALYTNGQPPAQDGTQPQGGGAWNSVLQGIAQRRATQPGQPPQPTQTGTPFAAGGTVPPGTTAWASPLNKIQNRQAPTGFPPQQAPQNMGGPATAPRIPATQAPVDQGAPVTGGPDPYYPPTGGGTPYPSQTAPATPAPTATPAATASSVPTNAAGTPTGAETGSMPSQYLSAYGPNNNLVGSQINPNANPDRIGIANQYFNEMQTASNPAYEASLRDATQRAAATGSLGSGMLNTTYGNLALQRAQNLDTLQKELQTQATEGTIGDQRFNTGVAQQQQGYQAAMAQQALQNRINQMAAEQGVGQGQGQYLSGYNPYWGITGSNIYGQQSQGSQNQLQQLMQAAGYGGQISNILGGLTSGAGATDPNEAAILQILGGQ